MIIRTSEAWIRPGVRAEFMARLSELTATFPTTFPAMIAHAVHVDLHDPDRVVYQSVWPDEAAIRHFAGHDWATAPVTFPDEDELLREPLLLRHFRIEG